MFAKRFDRFHDPEEVLIEMTRRQRRLKYVLSENKEETMYFIWYFMLRLKKNEG